MSTTGEMFQCSEALPGATNPGFGDYFSFTFSAIPHILLAFSTILGEKVQGTSPMCFEKEMRRVDVKNI